MSRKSHSEPVEDETTEGQPTSPPPVPASAPAPATFDPEDLKTEQEKGEPDPVNPSEPSPGPAETMEQLGIGARQPYPEGGAPEAKADEE